MNELDEPFNVIDGAFKSYIEKLIPIFDLLPCKKLNPWDMIMYGHINN